MSKNVVLTLYSALRAFLGGRELGGLLHRAHGRRVPAAGRDHVAAAVHQRAQPAQPHDGPARLRDAQQLARRLLYLAGRPAGHVCSVPSAVSRP